MFKVIAACGSGMGSSQIIKMKIEKIFKKHNVPVTIHHCSISEAKAQAKSYDVVFCSETLVGTFAAAEQSGTVVIGLKNLLSEAEIEQKILDKKLDQRK